MCFFKIRHNTSVRKSTLLSQMLLLGFSMINHSGGHSYKQVYGWRNTNRTISLVESRHVIIIIFTCQWRSWTEHQSTLSYFFLKNTGSFITISPSTYVYGPSHGGIISLVESRTRHYNNFDVSMTIMDWAPINT